MQSDLKISTAHVVLLDVVAAIILYVDLERTLLWIEIIVGVLAGVLTLLKIIHILILAYRRYKFKQLRNELRRAKRSD